MHKQIIWAPKAELEYLSTLDFWIEHNKSSTYSQKIITEVEAAEKRIIQFPFSNPVVYQTSQKEIRRVIILCYNKGDPAAADRTYRREGRYDE